MYLQWKKYMFMKEDKYNKLSCLNSAVASETC